VDPGQIILGNGAGAVKSLEDVRKACQSSMNRVTVGSITLEARAGNIGETYYFHPQEKWSLNSLGLPNPGMDAYKKLLPEMRRMAHGGGKKLWASIAGFTPEEYGTMAESCLKAGADGVEINLSCPNAWKDGERKQMPAEHPNLALQIISTVKNYTRALNHKSFAVKLSPTKDDLLLADLARHMRNSGIEYVVCSNTIPGRQRKREDGADALAFRTSAEDPEKKHAGGMAGSVALEESVWMTKHLRKLLPPAVQILGCGGIFTGADAYRYIEAGASGFQCTTACVEFGNQIFTDILMELVDLV